MHCESSIRSPRRRWPEGWAGTSGPPESALQSCGGWDKLVCCRSRSAGDGAAMQQIADWLEKLGMSEYAERFAESDIDISVLRDLTDQDLKELGVSLGHRRKMLRAIAELAGAAPTSPQPAVDRAKDPRHRRAPPSHGDVLGPGRLNGAFRAHGPRGPARGHFGLSEVRRRDRAPLRRLRGQIHGRRRARLFRLSAGP